MGARPRFIPNGNPGNPFLTAEQAAQIGGFANLPRFPDYVGYTSEDGTLDPRYRLSGQAPVTMSSILPDMESRLSGINVNLGALKALRQRGLTTGRTPWGELMRTRQGTEEQYALGRLAEQIGSAYGAGASDLAGAGGMSRGAQERLFRSKARDLASGRQGVRRQGIENRMGIDIQDENQKLDILKSLPGMEVQAVSPEIQKANLWSQFASAEQGRKTNLDLANRDYATNIDKTNLDTLLGDVGGRNDFYLKRYGEQMKGYAANKTAKAIEDSGKK